MIANLIAHLAKMKTIVKFFPFSVLEIYSDVQMRCAISTYRGYATVWRIVSTVQMKNLLAAIKRIHLYLDLKILEIYKPAQKTNLNVPMDNVFHRIWYAMELPIAWMKLTREITAVSYKFYACFVNHV